MHRLLNLTSNYPLKAASIVFAIIMGIWGLFSMISEISEQLGLKYAWGVAIFIGLLTIPFVLRAILTLWQNFRRGYALVPEQSAIILTSYQHWHFDKQGRRSVKALKETTYINEPSEDDLVDRLFGTNDVDYIKINYRSEDSEVLRTVQRKGTWYDVYWKPKVPIELGKPSFHSHSFTYPEGESPRNKSITAAALYRVQHIEIRITTENPITWHKAFRGSEWETLTDYKKLKKRASQMKDTNCAQLVNAGDNKEFTWKHENLMPREKYYLVFEIDN